LKEGEYDDFQIISFLLSDDVAEMCENIEISEEATSKIKKSLVAITESNDVGMTIIEANKNIKDNNKGYTAGLDCEEQVKKFWEIV